MNDKAGTMETYWIEFLEYWNGNVSINSNNDGNIKMVVGYTIAGHAIPTLEEAFWVWYTATYVTGAKL